MLVSINQEFTDVFEITCAKLIIAHSSLCLHALRALIINIVELYTFNTYSILKPFLNFEQSYARIGMAKEAADAASQAKDGELLGRLKLTFAQNAAASSIFDTLRDRLSFQGVS